MNKLAKYILVMIAVTAVCTATAEAANWTFRARHDGMLIVHGTINCDPTGDPLFEGPVQASSEYKGLMPDWANDYQIQFVDIAPCGNGNRQYKVKVDRWDAENNMWVLLPLAEWIDTNMTVAVDLPVIADLRMDGLDTIYSVVNFDLWLADPRPLRDTYEIVEGRCDDLPGFLISTTPIVFNPNVGPDEVPFNITPLTGPVNVIADLTLEPPPEPPTVSEWGLIIMALLLVTVGAIMIRKRRQVTT